MVLGTVSRTIKIYSCFNQADITGWYKISTFLQSYNRFINIEIADINTPGAGSELRLEQNNHLSKADIIILILSHNFNSDDLCWEMMKGALKRHDSKEARVIPIYLSYAYYDSEQILELEMLPKGRKPISIWTNKNKAWMNVFEGISQVIEGFIKKDGVKE